MTTITDKDTIYFLSQELAKAHLRIAELEAKPTEPTPPEPTPPAPFTGDWVEMGHAAIDASDIVAKAPVKDEWEWAVGDQRNNPSVPELWAHLLVYAQTVKNQKRPDEDVADSTRETKMAYLKGVASRLHLPNDEAFEIMFDKLQKKNDYETSYKQLTDEELEEYKCTDGKYLTTQRLREFCEEQLGKVESHDEMYNLMCLSLFAFHGNRKQDWQIGYKEMSPDGRGYYCPDTSVVHLFKGKTQKEGSERVFTVHPIVAQLIANVHEGKDSTCKDSPWLVPQVKDPTKCNTAFDKHISRKFIQWGFPSKINTTALRDLYETHIRYGEHKLPKEEIEQLMKIIGHSNDTALKKYAQLFRGMTEELS